MLAPVDRERGRGRFNLRNEPGLSVSARDAVHPVYKDIKSLSIIQLINDYFLIEQVYFNTFL